MKDDDNGDNKIKLIKIIGTIIVALITALGLMIASNNLPDNLQFLHDSIFGEDLTPANVLFSDYHEMYVNQIYPFTACVALEDSITNAQNMIPTDLVPLNATEGGGFIFKHGNISKIGTTTTNVSKLAGVKIDLTGDRVFDVTPATNLTSVAQKIPRNNPGQNFAIWKWCIVPRKEGHHTLYLEAYRIYDNGDRESIRSADLKIDVTVIPALTEVTRISTTISNMTAFAENVTEAAAEEAAPVVEATKESVTEAEAAKEAATEKVTEAKAAEKAATPGFESIFAITGLLAVAFLVLGKRE